VCTEGAITLGTADGIFDIHSGDVAVIPPNYPHTRLVTDDDDISSWCAVSFLFCKKQIKDSKHLYDLFESFLSGNNVVVLSGKHSFCSEISDVVKTSSEYDDIYPALRVVTALNGILHDFINSSREPLCTQRSEQPSDIDIVLLYKLNHIINSYFMKELTNAQIAEMLFISERQLSRIAAKHYGMSVHQAITDRRLATAEKLLRDTKNTVESIGTSIGYKSKSGFYRDFHKKYGLTPVEYRKGFRTNE